MSDGGHDPEETDESGSFPIPADALRLEIEAAVTAYFQKVLGETARMAPRERVSRLGGCVSQVRWSLEGVVASALAGAVTELHWAAAQAILSHWLAGETSYASSDGWWEFRLPKLSEEEARRVRELAGRTTIHSYVFSVERDYRGADTRASCCRFSIGDWNATATWTAKANPYDEREQTELTLTDFDPKAPSSREIEKKLQSGLPFRVLLTYLVLVAFDLLHHGSRPTTEYFSANDIEEDNQGEDGLGDE